MRVEVEEKTEDRRKFSQVEEMKTESLLGYHTCILLTRSNILNLGLVNRREEVSGSIELQ